jgi:hypothetical protein
MPKATVPVDTKTPMKFQTPDHTTAAWGSSVGRVVKAVHELERERDQQGDPENQEGKDRR